MSRRPGNATHTQQHGSGSGGSTAQQGGTTSNSLRSRIRTRGGKWGVRSLRLNLAVADENQDSYVNDNELIFALKRYGLGMATYEEISSALLAAEAECPGVLVASSSTASSTDGGSRPHSAVSQQRRGGTTMRTQYTSDFQTDPRGGPSRLSVRDAMPELQKKPDHKPDRRISTFSFMHFITGKLPRARLEAICGSYRLVVKLFNGGSDDPMMMGGGGSSGAGAAPTVEFICAIVGLDHHPDVVAGKVQLPDALFCFFTLWGLPLDAEVSEDLFVQFFADWSPSFVHNDPEFKEFMEKLFGKPPTDKRAQRRKLAPSRAESDRLFDSIDSNKNGTLSLAELDLAVIRYWPSLNYKPSIMRAYKLADTSGNGWLDKDEFEKFLHYLVIYNEMRDAFEAIDADGSRSITLDELKLNKHQVPGLESMNDVQLRNIFKQIDTNGGGKILFEEFCLFMAKRNGDKALTKQTNKF